MRTTTRRRRLRERSKSSSPHFTDVRADEEDFQAEPADYDEDPPGCDAEDPRRDDVRFIEIDEEARLSSISMRSLSFEMLQEAIRRISANENGTPGAPVDIFGAYRDRPLPSSRSAPRAPERRPEALDGLGPAAQRE